ncbi:LolA family protein [Streptomyces sp. KR80]|uniref:LolA family protein n=1 Tax=Streptomyces sp. KR80 TaxID=3457426 RepID=UPI003FD5F1C9
MLGKRPTGVTDDWDAEDEAAAAAPRRRAVRYAVPVAVAGLAAATIGLVPAFAGSGAPDLPKITAEDLIAKIAASDVQQLSGTVKISTDLGLPTLPGAGPGGALYGKGGKGDGSSAADPQAKVMELASGSHTLRVAADGPDRQRLSVIDDAAEYSLIHNGDEIWAYDSATNSAYHATAPEDRKAGGDAATPPTKGPEAKLANVTPQQLARQALQAVDETTSVTVDGTANVAGRDAYQLVIKPKQPETTVGSIRIAVDAEKHLPLKVTLAPRSGGKPVVDAGFTSVDFAKPAARTFEFTPPKGAEVTEQKEQREQQRPDGRGRAADRPDRDVEFPLDPSSADLAGLSGLTVTGEGWASVVRLAAPGADRPGAASGRSLPKAGSGEGGRSPEAARLIDSFGEKVTGSFGSGTVFSTRLVNALMTENGIYVGAVDKSALLKAAEEAAK